MSHVHMNSRGVIWIIIIIINVHNIYHRQIADKNSANIFAYLPYTHSNSDSAVFFFALSVFFSERTAYRLCKTLIFCLIFY